MTYQTEAVTMWYSSPKLIVNARQRKRGFGAQPPRKIPTTSQIR